MLKVDVEDGRIKALEGKGPLDAVLADLCIAVRAMYVMIGRKNREAGEAFRELLTMAIDDGTAFDGVEETEPRTEADMETIDGISTMDDLMRLIRGE